MHTYRFCTYRNLEQVEAHQALCAKLKATGLRMLHMAGGAAHCSSELDGKEIELETEHLFNDQWNTAPIAGVSDSGLRVFDWYEDANFQNPGTKIGHYLEITDEMREARRNRYVCGFCGRQEDAQKGTVFCGQCIDSEYLKEEELYLTRMRSVTEGRAPRSPLTKSEAERLVPEYRKAQVHGASERGVARLAKQRHDIVTKCDATVANATAERDGMLWLLDRGLKIDNVIYYSHTKNFSFGWRSPVSAGVKSNILEVISEFPFPYEIKSR